MAAERSELAKMVAELTERLRGIQAIQDQFVETTRQIQDVMLFGGHPELAALDDELDTIYRGQL